MIITFILVFVAGIMKACMDTLQFHYGISVFRSDSERWNKYSNPVISWANKYVNGDVNNGLRKVFGIPVPVMFTDFWHLVQSIFLLTLFASIVLYKPILNYPDMPILGTIFDYCSFRGVFGLSFTLFYNKLLLK